MPQDVSDTPAGLVKAIRAFCKKHGIAESTFGRLAVNDGKFVRRIAGGSRIEQETAERVDAFMRAAERGEIRLRGRPRRKKAESNAETMAELISQETSIRTPGSFAFFEQRQRYHVFANTTNESWVLADRIAEDLHGLQPRGPGIRIFFAPMDNGITLTRTLRALHADFPNVPVLVVLKGRGLEDLRNTMGRLVDRLAEHPLSVFVVTNLYVREAVDLVKTSVDNPHPVKWREVALEGERSYDYQQQIARLYGDLSREWLIRQGAHGQPVYERPSVVTIYRKDHRFPLEDIIPKPGERGRHYDYCLLNHPFLHSHTMRFRIDHVLSPVVSALAPGGQVTVVQSHGDDPAHEIVQRVWPDQPIPFTSRYDIIRELRRAMGARQQDYTFSGLTDARSLFRFDMHTLPVLDDQPVGALSLSSAWNNAVYFAEVKEELAQSAMREGNRYLEATAEVLARHGGLWFVNETFSVTRKPEE
jgi:hypothetical protein